MRFRRELSWMRAAVLAACLLTVSSSGPVHAAGPAEAPALDVASQQVQIVVDRLRNELGITYAVSATVLSQVALIMSVEAPSAEGRTFQLSVDHAFLGRLTAEELDAAIAHELGHVWVFTHHPYLQTERLANQIALRVVARQDLASVYRKLWQQGGTKGDLVAFLGPEADR